jgi:hypothetical protein
MLSSRAFGLNDFAREGEALAAANFAAEALVCAFGMARSGARRIAQIGFPDSIANANNHRFLLMRITISNENGSQ